MMSRQTLHRTITCALMLVALAICTNNVAQAQEASQAKPTLEDETNLDTALYLILASNERGNETPLPAVLAGVEKQLRATLPFKNYSLAATLLNRVKNNGHLNVTWIGGSLLAPHAALVNTPTFSQFGIDRVRLVDSKDGPVVQMLHFNYGARVPIQTATTIAASGMNSAPVFNYEPTGLTTDISVKPDQPGVVGTLNVGPSGDALVIVISVKRAMK